MAKVEIILPEGLEAQLAKLGSNTDRIVSASLKEGAKPIYKAVLEALDAVSPRPLVVRRRRMYNYGMRSTGDLRRHIGITSVRVNRKGDQDLKIGVGRDIIPGTKITYGRLVALIESGCKKRNQPPRPFMAKAKRASKEAANAAFIKKFNEEVDKL